MQRNAAIDKIRILLTMLVIFHHAAIIYGGSGGWYWREEENASNLLLLGFNAFNQSYFMGFFFLLAGYFTPQSFHKKGARVFMVDRGLRLGIPLVIYFFIISPFTVALAAKSVNEPIWAAWWSATLRYEFTPGPLWFLETLLILAIGFVVWKKLCPGFRRHHMIFPSVQWLALVAIGLGFMSFVVRLFIPVGESIVWLQLGYFPCYLFLFIAGCMVSGSQLLENISYQAAKPWMLVSAVAVISLPFMLLKPISSGAFEGGWNLNALFYALWDPVVAWGVILGLLWSFNRFFSSEGKFTVFLARRAFAVYIIHPPVLVAIGLCFSAWEAAPEFKLIMVGLLSCIACVAVASIVLLIPGARRII